MNDKIKNNPILTLLFILFSLSIVLLALQAARDILSPVIFSFVLAITASPLINWLKNRGIPDLLAFLLTITLVVVGILVLVVLVSSSVQDFTQTIQVYSPNLAAISQRLDLLLENFGLNIEGLTASEKIITPEVAMGLAAGFANDLISRLSNWILIIVTAIYFLLEATNMPRKVERIFKESHPDIQRFLRFNQDIRRFMSITAGAGLIIAILDVVLLLFLGVEFALLWGVHAFFMSFVPQVGIIIAFIPPAIMALVQFGFTEMLIVIAGYLIINQVVDVLFKRPYMQKKLDISMIVIFISLILWGWILGPIGVILSVPMALMVKAILDSRKETRWLAYLMGDGQEPFNPNNSEEPENEVKATVQTSRHDVVN